MNIIEPLKFYQSSENILFQVNGIYLDKPAVVILKDNTGDEIVSLQKYSKADNGTIYFNLTEYIKTKTNIFTSSPEEVSDDTISSLPFAQFQLYVYENINGEHSNEIISNSFYVVDSKKFPYTGFNRFYYSMSNGKTANSSSEFNVKRWGHIFPAFFAKNSVSPKNYSIKVEHKDGTVHTSSLGDLSHTEEIIIFPKSLYYYDDLVSVSNMKKITLIPDNNPLKQVVFNIVDYSNCVEIVYINDYGILEVFLFQGKSQNNLDVKVSKTISNDLFNDIQLKTNSTSFTKKSNIILNTGHLVNDWHIENLTALLASTKHWIVISGKFYAVELLTRKIKGPVIGDYEPVNYNLEFKTLETSY